MEFYLLDRDFRKIDLIDEFESALWTERYYGDGDFQIQVPATPTMLSKLPQDQFILLDKSDQPGIIENREIKDGLLKVNGISLTKWMNNRFFFFMYYVQGPPTGETRPWTLSKEWAFDIPPGTSTYSARQLLSVYFIAFCTDGTGWLIGDPPVPYTYLKPTVHPTSLGIFSTDEAERIALPNFVIGEDIWSPNPDDIPISGKVSLPFGPWYDAFRPFAEAWTTGMKIVLNYSNGIPGEEEDYQLAFHAYRGKDRTSNQTVNRKIQFSPEMNSFINITDLESVSNYTNMVYVQPTSHIAHGNFSSVAEETPAKSGWDLRVKYVIQDDLYTEDITQVDLDALEANKAKQILGERKPVNIVDGEAVERIGSQYGVDFDLGDIVEVQGNTGVLQTARITEFIRSQDSTGERAFPTLSMIDE